MTRDDREGKREVMPFKAPAPRLYRGRIAEEDDRIILGVAILPPPGEFA